MKHRDGGWWMSLMISVSLIIFGMMIMNGGYVSYKYQVRVDFGELNSIVGFFHVLLGSFFICRLMNLFNGKI